MGIRAAIVASLCFASPALAQPNKPPTDAQKQQAGDLVKRAIAKSQTGDHAAAIELYLQAYQLIPAPLLLSDIGTEYQQQGSKQVEALKYFCKYLETDPTGTSADYATAQAKVLQIQLGNKDVDDRSVCKPPEPVVVKPVDQPPVTPPSQQLPAGPSQRSSLQYSGLGVGAIGVVSLALGIVYGYEAKTASDKITNWPTGVAWPTDIQQEMADGHSDQTKQIVFLVIGGAAVATGGILYYLGHKSAAESAEHTSLVPVVTPNGGGLALGGRF